MPYDVWDEDHTLPTEPESRAPSTAAASCKKCGWTSALVLRDGEFFCRTYVEGGKCANPYNDLDRQELDRWLHEIDCLRAEIKAAGRPSRGRSAGLRGPLAQAGRRSTGYR